ncbi:MAG: hypothetical protein M1813_004472 [Trichoglossum hirsutum]|nr:MAG: hypothetical protein M1813_004472 [Trichoglossum hirsutum]
MDFPVSWDIEQLGLSHCLYLEFKAAEILEQHGYRACIVGDVTSVVYGSDVVISDIYIAIADEQLQSALETLLGHGFLEEPQTDLRFTSTAPMKDSSSGWPGHRLRRQQPKQNTKGILLIPATLWHLDLGESRFSSDTLLYPRSMCRLPRLEPYLNALICTLVERVPDHQLNPSLTHYIQAQYAVMLTLLPAHHRPRLPIENQFFIDFFRRMILPRSKVRFFSLWQEIRDGSLSTSDAVAKLPRKDMAIAEMEAKHAR